VLRRGECLGQYRLLFHVGSGGMAHVWAAARSGDYGFQRLFAVKVMREDIADIASYRKMFLDEAKLAARVHHTNVVEVIDLGEEAGTVYQVMPLLEGDSLAGLLRDWRTRQEEQPEAERVEMGVGARVPLGVGVRVMIDVLRGLHAAHEMKGDGGVALGIVHRDVSPQNILVGVDGISKIADFGVAKVVSSFVDETDAGTPKGKVAYMAPEQLEKAKLDRRCDVFAAGVVLWELLAGSRLAPSAASTLLGGSTIEDPRAKGASVPRELAEIAMRALERRPGARFPSADAMADALEEAARACGLALSTKEVASWTAQLTTSRLAKRRGDLAEAATLLSSEVAASPARARRKRPLGVAAMGLALGLCGVGAGWLSARAANGTANGTSREAQVAASAASAVSPPATASAALPAEQSAIGSPEAASASAPQPAPAAQAPTSSARTAPRRPTKPRDAAPTRPKFQNPYAP
jgi:serine/threonine-protein kinase